MCFKYVKDLHSSGMLRNIDWWLVIDVSKLPTILIFKGHAILLGLLETSLTNEQSTLCNMPEELFVFVRTSYSLLTKT